MVKALTNRFEETFRRLRQEGYPFAKIITFLLDVQGYDKSRVAKEAGVSLSLVSLTVSDQRNSERVKKTISKALGFDPWRIFNEEVSDPSGSKTEA